MKRSVVGIGETILDIVFKKSCPVAAVPGGSCFNTIISLGRAGLDCQFVGYAAEDAVGRQTRCFLEENGVGTRHFRLREGEKSSISLAYLDERGDADYVFYKLTPSLPEGWEVPKLGAGDVLVMGSYFAIAQGTRRGIASLLREARGEGAIVYYDLNFRRSHLDELEALTPAILSNFDECSVVRGSADDFDVMYGTHDPELIYREHIAPHCPIFICTAGEGDVSVCTPGGVHRFPVPSIEGVVSTIGAGDNFNAGLIYGLVGGGIMHDDLVRLSSEQWRGVIASACDFAREACRTTDNYIGRDFAASLKQ